MRHFGAAHRWGAVFLSVAIAALVVACSSVGDPCQFDADCSGGNLCVQSTCYEPCTSAGDCEAPYGVCHAHERSSSDGEQTVRVCVEEGFVAQQQHEEDCESVGDCCETDAQCAEAFGDEDYVCGFDKRCILPVVVSHGVLIRGVDGAGGPGPPGDGAPGADIAAVYIRRAGSDEPVGHATTLHYEPADDPQETPPQFDGTPRALSANGQCVDGSFADTAVPLGGDGGELLVGFDDEQGEPLRLNTNWRLVVIEWGDSCPSGVDESFEVWFCEAEQVGALDSDRRGIDVANDCNRRLSPEGGALGNQVLPLDADQR